MGQMTDSRLILASSSPRRLDILRAIGLEPSVEPIGIDEQRLFDEAPDTFVLRLAHEKAAAWFRRPQAVQSERVWVLAADTTVVLGGDVLGKPTDRSEGIDMLRRLGGKTHEVLTGVALGRNGDTAATISRTEVTMRELGSREAAAYWETGEPCDKAGAYALQGLGGMFITEIRGSYSGVVGLPVFETVELLGESGFPLPGGLGHA